MKCCWLHSFPPGSRQGGSFMFEQIPEFAQLGTTVEPVYTPNVRNPVEAMRIARSIEERNYDLVHVQYGSGCGYVGSKLSHPKLLTLRGSDWYGIQPQSLRERAYDLAIRTLTRRSLPAYDAVVSVSERIRREVSEVSDVPVFVIPSGLDLDRFRPQPRAAARQQLGHAEDTSTWVLFSTARTGNVVKRYGLAAEAVDRLRERVPNARLKIMTGVSREDVPAFVNAADLVLLTSTHEGWPNIIKEAMACNVPFVSTDVSDLVTVANRAPDCFVVEDSPQALAEAMYTSLSYPGETETRGMARAFDARLMARNTADLYRDVIALRNSKTP